ncbi:MAG: hypothetical protein KDC53_17875, partial [Saprospiraceae bacterium]|nr:hypothetical protein [Saprospiraceae bacterium]
MGKFWSPGSDQGIYKSSNGGISWKKVLYVNERTRANDIVIAPSKPSVLYATMWENNIDTTLAESVYGPASAVYKSEDLGEHWIRMSNGLPSGPRTGRMGVTVSYTNPDIAYVLVDNLNKARDKASEIYKTEDGGKSWKRTHEDDLLFSSVIGWYFTDIYINPQDDQEIFALGVRIAHSLDGGRTFSYLDGEVQHINPSPAQTLHLDQCEFWIDPLNSEHIAVGNDGGFYQSYDKGSHWIHYNNIPAGEFYTITLDEKNTYEIYGGTQDDATVLVLPREYLRYGPDDWQYLWIDAWSGGDGCITQLDPDDQNIIYFSMQEGYVMRLDRSSGDATPVRPKPEVADFQNQAYNFVTPYFISEHQGQTLYHAGNYVYKSIDRGDNWQCISPDLSNSGVRAKKSVAASALTESPLQAGLLFVGTDHGAFWLSTDDGNHWEERSTGLANNYIRSIAPSNFKHDRLYVSMTGLDYDDQNVCLYRSDDLGQHWQSISSSLPNQPANVVLEDPNFEDIVYVGMHRGVFISLDRGENWQVLGTDFPMVPVADLKINKADELIVATHGRGIYKIDLSPIYFLRKVKPGLPDDKTYLFPVLDFKAAKRRASHHDVDLASIIKQNFYYYLDTSGIYELVIQRLSNE